MTLPAMMAAGRAIKRYATRMSGCIPRRAETITVPVMASSKNTVKQNNVPINVSRATRKGTPYQCGERVEAFDNTTRNDKSSSCYPGSVSRTTQAASQRCTRPCIPFACYFGADCSDV